MNRRLSSPHSGKHVSRGRCGLCSCSQILWMMCSGRARLCPWYPTPISARTTHFLSLCHPQLDLTSFTQQACVEGLSPMDQPMVLSVHRRTRLQDASIRGEEDRSTGRESAGGLGAPVPPGKRGSEGPQRSWHWSSVF